MLSQYQKIQLQGQMTSIIRCLNTFPKPHLTLLHIFNSIWTTGVFPESWRLATIIPIPKPGKDHAEPTNYRPIALTSCLSKTLERMINKRLVWYLESNNLLTKFQSGFRAERSTYDNLVRPETFIRDAFIKLEHVVAVFFEFEKTYDTTWRYGMLKDLHNFGLKGHHWGVQLILAYSWARPAILVVGKGRGGMFLFLLFLHFHSCSSFFPVPLFHLLYSLFYLFSPFLWETTQNDPQGLTCR